MQKPKLYLDFDGVIANSIDAIVSLYNDDFQAYPDYHYIKPDDINTWNFEECKCATSDVFDMYFNTPRFFDNLGFMDQADTFIWLLSYQFDFVIVSHGNSPNLKLKKMWIDKKLKLFINDTKMLNQGSVDFIGVDFKDYDDKSHIDMSDGIFVEDTYENLITSNAKYKIVFGEQYPWNIENEVNRATGLGESYTRCVDWLELYQEIIQIYNIEKLKVEENND